MKNATLLFLIFLISAGNIHSEIDCKSAEYIEIENCINVDEKEIPSPSELERKYLDKSESKKDEYFKIYAFILRHKNPNYEKERN